jgi:hypothetical protein
MGDTAAEGLCVVEKPKFSVWLKYTLLDIAKLLKKKEPSPHFLRCRKELELAGLFDKGPDSLYDGMIAEAVMRLIETHSKEGHSGMSHSITVDIFHRLMRDEVLSPLKGTPDEWNDMRRYGDSLGTSYQNKRMSAVFADGPNGEGAHFIEGRVFTGKDGVSFSTGAKDDPLREKGSSVSLTFPCIPKTVYIREGTPEAEPFKHVFEEHSNAD